MNQNLKKAVIEIDEVEYFIDDFAAEMIEKDVDEVILRRLFDGGIFVLSTKEIQEIIQKNGIVDHLD